MSISDPAIDASIATGALSDLGTPQALCNRRPNRDRSGRFATPGAQSRRKGSRARQQRDYLKVRAVLKKTLFEEYLHAFCRPGRDEEYLPTSRSKGPLVEIFERLLKTQYRLGRPERRKQMRAFYLDGGHLHRHDSSVVDNSRGNATQITLPVKAKKYDGCRLPYVSRRMTEMSDVKAWLQLACSKKALITDDVEEAYNLCKAMIEGYNPENTTAPPVRHGNSTNTHCSHCNGSFSPVSDGAEEITQAGIGEQTENTNHSPDGDRSVPSESIENVTADVNNCRSRPSDPVPSDPSVGEDISRKKKMEAVIDAAKNDNTFLMVCLLFDEELETEFGLFADVCLKECRREGTEPTKLMKEVLLFAQAKRFGVVNRSEHQLREKRLRSTMLLFEAARVSVGAKPYRDMRWKFL